MIFAILGLANRWYAGGFSTIEANEQNMDAYTIAYKNFVGEYAKVWPTMTEVYDILSGAGITSMTGVGIYYDDPAVVTWAELKSDIGSVITPEDVRDLLNNSTWIMIKTIAGGNKVVVEFPLKNSISYMIGPMKVYPAIAKYMAEKWYNPEVAMIELYDMQAKKIYYITDIK